MTSSLATNSFIPAAVESLDFSTPLTARTLKPRGIYSSASSTESNSSSSSPTQQLTAADEKDSNNELPKFCLPPHADAIHTHTHIVSSAATRLLHPLASNPTSFSLVAQTQPTQTNSNVSQPNNVHRIFHVEWNEKRKAFTGVPDVWSESMPQGAEYASSSTLPSHISPRIQLDDKGKQKTPVGNCLPSRANLTMNESLAAEKSKKLKKKAKSSATMPLSGPSFTHSHPSAAVVSHLQAIKQPTVSRPQVSVREYMKALGFLELDNTKHSPAVLREMLLSKLSFGVSVGLFLRSTPYVLKLKIFSYLDYQSLIRVCSVCTEMLQYIENRSLWKPLVQLKNREQRVLYYSSPLESIKSRDWKKSFITMTLLDKNVSYFDLLWNVVVIGDKGVGKSKLVHTLGLSGRMAMPATNSLSSSIPRSRHSKNNSFSLSAQAALLREDPVLDPVSGIFRLGIDFVTRRVALDSTVIKLQVWDGTAFANIFNKAHVVAIVFDTSRQSSFDQIPLILADTRRSLNFLNLKDVAIILFGNVTSDESDRRQVHYEVAKRFANSVGMIYVEGNACSEESVDQAFAQLAVECWNIANNGNGNPLGNAFGVSTEKIEQSKCSIM